LGIVRGISREDLQKHFKGTISRKIHPDKSKLSGIAKDRLTAAFQKAKNAYDELLSMM
jgi:DnaJ-class molecular chaperone